jgi:hypothetical protein
LEGHVPKVLRLKEVRRIEGDVYLRQTKGRKEE